MNRPARIDTHQHLLPPDYRSLLSDRGITPGGVPLPDWSRQTALDIMGSHGIGTGMLSLSAPGVHLEAGPDGASARDWARRFNEYAADVVRDDPTHFGFFATLTLPDLDGALAEAAYALDVLRADGIVLLANYDGTYLGDPAFEPLFAELGSRGAVVFVHPNELPGPGAGIPPFALDFLLDTSRAALKLAASGTLDRYPDLRVVLSHGGGFVPYVVDRIARFRSDENPETGRNVLRRFWFDVALAAGPSALPSLLGFADPSHLTYGSDFPFAPVSVIDEFDSSLKAYSMDEALRHGIDRGNAEKLFPRLAE